MELMYRRVEGEEIREGYLRNYEADFDITTDVENATNDFEIRMDLPKSTYDLLWKENEVSCIVYVDGEEYGGIISGSEIDIEAGTITYSGWTWRGLLNLYIIEPPSGQDYRVVTSGTNLATALRALPMNPYISVQNTSYRAKRQFQYNRYIPVHEGATNLLKDTDSDLRMYFKYDEDSGKALLTIGKTTDRTDLIEISQDYDDRVRVSITRDGNTPKHVICMGGGELKDREIVHLYADDDWNVGTTAISGAYPVNTYEYSGSDSLLSDGKKHFKELIDQHTQIEVFVSGIKLNLGDVIAAREILTGQYVTAEITKIVWKNNDAGLFSTETFEYTTAVRAMTKAVKNRTYNNTGQSSGGTYGIDNVVSYYQTPTLSVANTLNKQSSDWTSFAFITDMHGNGNKQHSQAIALYLLDNTNMSMIVLGGDYCVSGWDKTEYDTYMSPFKNGDLVGNVYALMGNHETFANGSAEAKQSIYNDFLKDKTWIAGSLTNNYYYMDDIDRKIRYLFLNTSDGGSSSVQYTMTSTQVDWIKNHVTLPDSSWSLLVLGHVNLCNMGVSSSTMTESTETNGAAIISAIKECNGKIIGYICGHQHVDITGKWSGIQQTTLLCDKFENTNYYDGISVTNRESGKVTEQAVSVVSINSKTKQVVIRRIGAGRNSTISYYYK